MASHFYPGRMGDVRRSWFHGREMQQMIRLQFNLGNEVVWSEIGTNAQLAQPSEDASEIVTGRG